MRRRDPRHPIHKCGNCMFNLRTRCAVYDDPKAQWDRGSCTGFDNEALIDAVEKEQPDVGAELRRRVRREQARRNATEPHHEGNSPHIADNVSSRHGRKR